MITDGLTHQSAFDSTQVLTDSSDDLAPGSAVLIYAVGSVLCWFWLILLLVFG